MHSEMGPVRQNPIQRTVRTAHLSMLMTAQWQQNRWRYWYRVQKARKTEEKVDRQWISTVPVHRKQVMHYKQRNVPKTGRADRNLSTQHHRRQSTGEELDEPIKEDSTSHEHIISQMTGLLKYVDLSSRAADRPRQSSLNGWHSPEIGAENRRHFIVPSKNKHGRWRMRNTHYDITFARESENIEQDNAG